MYSKSSQTNKVKKKNDKKLSEAEKDSFVEKINEISKGKCQLCKEKKTDEYHHSVFGRMGADKDDRTLMAICRECHYEIHHGKNGNGRSLRNKAIVIGAKNWKAFKKKGNKFNAKKTVVTFQFQEYEFDSKAEAKHFTELCGRLKRFEISRLSTQPEFILTSPLKIDTDKTKSGKSRIGYLKYTPDFQYIENSKKVVVEVKGKKTEAYTIRFKLFLALAYSKYGVDTFIEIVDGKATSYDCSSVCIEKVDK